MVAVLALAQTSCSSDDRVFDDSSANRMENAINEYKELLVSAENGWCLEMFPGEKHEYLGASIYLKFDKDGKVTATSDYHPVKDGYNVGDLFESRYELIKQQGPLLSFITYNPFVHIWSEPSGSDVDGYESDYEFVVTKASATEFELKGRKRGVTLHMYALDKSVDWKKSCEERYAMRDKCEALKTVALYSGSKKLGSGKISYSAFSISGENGVYESTFLTTETGIKFYAPINIDGNLVSEFTYDETAKELKAVGADVKIVFERPADYISLETYLNGKWTFACTSYEGTFKNIPVKFTLNKDGSLTFTAEGKELEFPTLICTYDDSTGMIEFVRQYVGTVTTASGKEYHIYLCQSNGSSIKILDDGTGLVTETKSLEDDKQVLTFVSNGSGYSDANCFYFEAFSGYPGTSGNKLGWWNFYKDMTLTLTK